MANKTGFNYQNAYPNGADMEGFVKDSLAQAPRYLSAFYQTLTSPKSIADNKAKITATIFNEALLFLAISVLITVLIRLPLIGRDKTSVIVLASYVVWAVCVLLSMTSVVKLAWRIVGGKMAFVRYLALNCYYFGVFMVVGHFISLASFSVGKAAKSVALSIVVAAIGFLAFSVWGISAWRVYQQLNSIGWLRSLGALSITLIAVIPVAILLLLVQRELLGVSVSPIFPIHP
ncbi:MAG: hypothetical protein SF097_09025 [Acidobacteriota bacterium]|nr:hypothetical protein [Acidobacteriota bacterium]